MISSVRFDEPIESATISLRRKEAPDDHRHDITRKRTPSFPVSEVLLPPHDLPDGELELIIESEA